MPVELNCNLCDKKFSRRYNLMRHFSAVHPEKKIDLPPRKCVALKCGICQQNSSDFENFKDHVFTKHDISLVIDKYEFENEADFYCWKKTIEEKENVLLVKNSGKNILACNAYVIYFQCHRSGYFTSKVFNNRKREIKIQGSSKINAYCPFRMKAIFFADGEVKVEFCVSHVGHKTELEHMNLPYSVRKSIAEKIASKVPFEDILDEVRSIASGDDLQRKHFITRHDLYNIEKEFNLKTGRNSNPKNRKISQDSISVNDWIIKEKQTENSCILVHKPQGIFSSDYPNVNKNDFLLVIMTDGQIGILKKIGTNCICIDSTHGKKNSKFDLVSLFVVDDFKQGFPCAFFISNRIDDEGLDIFFSAVKNKIGLINAKIFLSETNILFYRVWQKVMATVEAHLFCWWHVDQDWNKALYLIKNPFKRKDTYKLLKTLLEEFDRNTFQAMLAVISQQLLDDEETRNFGLYFQSHYQNCSECWANSYRKDLGIYYNLNLEQMHQTIKYLYFKGKTLDKAIQTIMHVLKNKFFDYLTVLEKGERIAKLRDLRIRHHKSLNLSTDLVSQNQDGSWKIASSSKLTLLYVVRLVKANCDCSITCQHCNSCIHQYSCTCVDACVKWNMCKHIHLLCRSLASVESENTVEVLDLAVTNSYETCSEEVIPENLCPSEEVVEDLNVNEEATVCEILDVNDFQAQEEVGDIEFETEDQDDEIVQLGVESSSEQVYLLHPVLSSDLIDPSFSFLELKYDLVKQFSEVLNGINTVDDINFIKEQISSWPFHLNSFQQCQLNPASTSGKPDGNMDSP